MLSVKNFLLLLLSKNGRDRLRHPVQQVLTAISQCLHLLFPLRLMGVVP
jgi:hypothetical protein